MRAPAECRCCFCLDRIPLIVKAGIRSKVRLNDAACRHCEAYRIDHTALKPADFLHLVSNPPEGAPDGIWLIYGRRISNAKAFAGVKLRRYLAPRKEAAE